MHMTTTYAKVRIGKPVFLEVESSSDKWLVGQEVDRQGSRLGRKHVIDRSAVEEFTPMRMNNHYGELEAAGCQVCGVAAPGFHTADHLEGRVR